MSNYVYVVSDERGVRYATDSKYRVRWFFGVEHLPGKAFTVVSVRWDGAIRHLDPAEFVSAP